MNVYEIELEVKVGDTTKEDRFTDNILKDACKYEGLHTLKPYILTSLKNIS